jgi:serine/threonine protein kinase
MIGETLSHYKIIEKLGQGGMGEVYLAEDSRLDRKVALKILPQHLSDRAELRERFEREARAVSSLNHPHICTLHDIGEQDGIHYLVMEHLEGETLSARLEKGPLPLEQTLEYGIQVADALDKAHRQGVVHRDLKPGNIMLTKSGAKLLDFGLAKLQATDTPTNLSALPTEQANLTAEGTILGTLQYMAPEQLEGKEADSRTDIFAFGAVVYEMATGKKAFEGKSQASLIGAIMQTDPPPMAELQPMTPSFLDRVVKKCLAKEPDERWQTATDLLTGLRWVTEVGTQVGPSAAVAAPAAWKRAIPWGVTLLMGTIAFSIAFWSSPLPTSPPLTKFFITPSPSTSLAIRSDPAISADGRYVLYRANTESGVQLYLRSLDDFEDRLIPGTEGALFPFFSPDAQFVGFFANADLKKVSLGGGSPITLTHTGPARGSGSWSPDGTIVFSSGPEDAVSLYRVSAAGGEKKILASADREKGESWYEAPHILPDGKTVLFTIVHESSKYQLATLSSETGEQKILIEDGRQGEYVETGHLIYEQPGTGNLMAVLFDLAALEVRSNPIPVLQGSQSNIGTVAYAVSDEGTLVYVPTSEKNRLVWVDRNGKVEPLTRIQRRFDEPRLSPDGTSLSVTIWDGFDRNIWIYEIAREILTPLLVEGRNMRAIWSPDGQELIFTSNRESGGTNLFWMPTDGSADAKQLTTSGNPQFATSWSPDGLVAYVEFTGQTADLFLLPFEGERETESILATQYDEHNATFSPNGQWIAFTSDRSGQTEVYVKPYPGQGGIVQISTEGGLEPVWARGGKELFYRSGDKMMVVSVQTDTTFKAEKPRLLFEGSYRYNFTNVTSNYDVTADGQQFVMVKEEGQNQIHVVLNWFEELKRLVPTDN